MEVFMDTSEQSSSYQEKTQHALAMARVLFKTEKENIIHFYEQRMHCFIWIEASSIQVTWHCEPALIAGEGANVHLSTGKRHTMRTYYFISYRGEPSILHNIREYASPPYIRLTHFFKWPDRKPPTKVYSAKTDTGSFLNGGFSWSYISSKNTPSVLNPSQR